MPPHVRLEVFDGLSQLDAAWRLLTAALIGLGVGIEREWSGHATGARARFAGVRTFFLIGLIGGTSGILLAAHHDAMAAAFAAAGAGIALAAYILAVRHTDDNLDGTTEVAAMVVVALGVLAGAGSLGLAAGAGSLVVLALREKERLHWLVSKVAETELRAAVQFMALALVILPLLPSGPIWGDAAVRPRALWTVVLVFSALNFAGYVAQRVFGPTRGYGIAGAFGGLVSSTAVALAFARHSAKQPALAVAFARGVVAACAVLAIRVIIVASVLYPPVGTAALPYLVPSAVAGVLVIGALGWPDRGDTEDGPAPPGNPLRLRAAVQMAVVFQVAMTALTFARGAWGTGGAYMSGVALGLTDMDALTFSMSRPDSGMDAALAARVIAVGVVANSVLKASLCLVLGAKAFRWRAALGIGAMGAAVLVALWVRGP